MKKYARQMFNLRALALSALAAYLLLAIGLRMAQRLSWAPEGTLTEVVIGRINLGLIK